mgnify:FL=1
MDNITHVPVKISDNLPHLPVKMSVNYKPQTTNMACPDVSGEHRKSFKDLS